MIGGDLRPADSGIGFATIAFLTMGIGWGAAQANASTWLDAAQASELVVLGRPGPTRTVDRLARTTELRVDRVLRGEAEGTIPIAWEELAPRRAHLPEDMPVLVALEAFPGQTLWRARFPTLRPRVIAERGRARLLNPSAEALDTVAILVGLSPPERGSPEHLLALLDLAALSEQRLAESGLEGLRATPGLASVVQGEVALRFATVVGSEQTLVEIRRGLLALVAERRIRSQRDVAELLTTALGPVEASAWHTLGSLDGGLEGERVTALLEHPGPEHRIVGLKWLSGSDAASRLRTLAQSDSAAAVRAAALSALVNREGAQAAPDLVQGLADGDPVVATASVAGIGQLRQAAVPALQAAVSGEDPELRRAGVIGLSAAGASGRAVLDQIARSHPDEELRKLARFALGRIDRH